MWRIVLGMALTLTALAAGAQPETESKAPGTEPSERQAPAAVESTDVGSGTTQSGGGASSSAADASERHPAHAAIDYFGLLYVFVLATFIGLGVVARVSRLLHTPLMSLTNAISAIAVVGSIIVAGSDYPLGIRILGAIALLASMTNVVSGFLITDRMLRMFKQSHEKGSA